MVTRDDTFRPLPLIAPRPPKREGRRGERRGTAEGEGMLALMERIEGKAAERRSHRERRATPRKPVSLEWEENVGEARLVRLTSDLSTFGLSSQEGPAHPRGTKLRVRLYLPDEPLAPLVLAATVVGDWEGGRGVRLRFEKPPVEAARRIHRYLASQTTA